MYDSIIIGAGIAGITSAIYLKRSNKKILLIESKMPGGQINKTSRIDNYPGYLGDGPTLVLKMLEQLKKLGIEITYGNVVDIENQEKYKIVKTNNCEYKTSTIIIATGREPRKPDLKNLDKLVGHGVSYCASCDGYFYKNKDVIVQGGGNSALEESLLLSDIVKTVTIVHRKDKFTADQILIDEVNKKQNINIKYNSTIQELIESNGILTGIKLDTGEILNASALFIYIGLIPTSYFLSKLGIKTQDNYIIVNDKMETSIKGIYACGDIIKKDIYQLVTAASEGATSAINVIKYIKGL